MKDFFGKCDPISRKLLLKLFMGKIFIEEILKGKINLFCSMDAVTNICFPDANCFT